MTLFFFHHNTGKFIPDRYNRAVMAAVEPGSGQAPPPMRRAPSPQPRRPPPRRMEMPVFRMY